jgi:putative membrane protein
MKILSSLLVSLAMIGPAGAQTTSSTQEFVNKVAISDMFEIQSSKLAEKMADAESKSFAQTMVKDHTKTSDELKELAGRIKATLPATLDDEHKKKLDDLSKLRNADQFDDAYDKIQVEAHEEAVKLFTAYSRNGDNAELKAWAGKTLPALQHHLEMAKKLK